MAEAPGETYLSIGEVLGLLLEEFPDVTISKIRFLESQGLISPERTASGYRKFYDDDVDLLRVILTEQRQNFLPLRVIKDRLETGEIDPTGEHLRPSDASPNGDGSGDESESGPPAETHEVPARSRAAHPAARGHTANSIDTGDTGNATPETEMAIPAEEGDEQADDDHPAAGATAQLLPGVLLDRSELCAMVGMTESELDQLESFGVVRSREDGAGGQAYGDDAVEIAKPACEFLRAGIDARHLRNFRNSADREALLYEQLVAPRFRQRNPEAHAEALAQLRELEQLGGTLRAAMMRHALGHHFRP